MKKILFILTALLGLSVSGAWAETYTITFDHRTGTFYKSGAVSTGWVNQWVSNEEGKPAVTITASANNINTANGRMAPGSSQSSTYTLSTESGYRVTGFSMNCPTFGAEVTVTPAGESAIVVATGGTLVVNSSASSFVYSGSNDGRIQPSAGDGGTFTITVEEDTEAPSWIPSFGIGSTIVVTGDKAESVTAATNGADNDHWYLVTQVRNGESALYDDGNKLMRGTTAKTAASFNGETVENNSAYLVRFISAGSEDLYHIQLGNGRFIVNLDANPQNGTAVNTTSDYWSKGTHAFYNSNGGSGSYFGWNLNSKTAKRVDNNGAGNALSYWGEGTASGTSGNSIWYVYPVTINTPASTVEVTYNLVVGGNIVNTIKETLAANSEVNVPSGLTAGYASSYYNFNTSGTIGEEDCTITITAELKDNTIVYPYTNISNDKSYYIYTNNQARGGLSTYTDGETTYLAASVKTGLSLSPKKFAIISYEENYYLYSVEDAKFVTFDGTDDKKAALAATVTGMSDRITFTQTNAPLYEVKFDGSSSKIFNSSNSSSYPYGIVFNTWGASSNQWDDGCQYTINEADDFDPTDAVAALEAFFHPSYTITYIVKDVNGNTIFTSEPVPAELGAHITSLPAKYQRTFCSYNSVDVTISEVQTDIEFTATYDLPFTLSTSYAEATWYYATIRGTKYLRADDDAKDSSGRYATNSTNEHTDAYKWAFFGNPYEYFYVMNKNQGDGKYMAKDVQIVFSSLADPTADNNALWAVTSNSNGGFTLRNLAGGDTWYVNDAGNNGNLGFWNSGSGANDSGSNWTITEVPAYEVTVTYDLNVGGEKVNTVVEEYVAGGSAVNVPASLIANYSSLGYDFSTSADVVANENCTITVTATLKSGMVTSLSGLSNSKSYTLTTKRGALYIKSDHLASNSNDNAGADAGKFALINLDDNYYLYSVDASKYVLNDGSLSSGVTSDVVALNMTEQSVSPLFLFVLGTNGMNVTDTDDDYELIINSYVTPDDGNRYVIKEVDDFDATDVAAALDEFFNGPTAFAAAIAELKAINWGLTASGNNGKPSYYNFIGTYAGYAGNEMGFIEGLESAGYSRDHLAIAQDILANGYALNMPATGKFYRITSTHGTYLSASGTVIDSANDPVRLSYITTADASTIFYFDGEKLYDFAQGFAANGRATGALGGAGVTYWFEESTITAGKYAIRFNPDGGSDRFLYAWGEGKHYADQNGSDHANCVFTIEEVTTLPVTISDAGYATLYAPVALSIPENVTVSTLTINVDGEHLDETSVDGTIPAGTPVLLKGDAGNYSFATTTNVETTYENVLVGTYPAIPAPNGSYILQKQGEKVGFYLVDTSEAQPKVPGFRAYLQVPGESSDVKAFFFSDIATGVSGVKVAAENAATYNLAGQRVAKATKGIYIVNGKKVLVK